MIAVPLNQAFPSEARTFNAACNAITSTRQNQLGIFAAGNWLRLLPF
jgi:hypothetical protein